MLLSWYFIIQIKKKLAGPSISYTESNEPSHAPIEWPDNTFNRKKMIDQLLLRGFSFSSFMASRWAFQIKCIKILCGKSIRGTFRPWKLKVLLKSMNIEKRQKYGIKNSKTGKADRYIHRYHYYKLTLFDNTILHKYFLQKPPAMGFLAWRFQLVENDILPTNRSRQRPAMQIR